MNWDPLLCRTDLGLEAEFHPLGFPFTVRSNSQLVLDAARRSFGVFPSRFPVPRIEARLLVVEGAPDSIPPAPVFRAQHNLLAMISDAHNFAVCDLENGFAFGCLAPAVAADRDFVRFHLLEAIAYTLLTQLCVTPIHASCVAWHGNGVLLCGMAGAGKSSLAYACARRGWTLISDNACYLLDCAATPSVTGRPHAIRFQPAAAGLFPELHPLLSAGRANGKIALDLSDTRVPGVSIGFGCPARFLVFLARRAGVGARLSPVARDEAFERLAGELPRFRDEVEQRHRQSILKLVQAGAWELQYASVEDGVEQLDRLVNGA